MRQLIGDSLMSSPHSSKTRPSDGTSRHLPCHPELSRAFEAWRSHGRQSPRRNGWLGGPSGTRRIGELMTYPRHIMFAILALAVTLGLGAAPALAQEYGAPGEASPSAEAAYTDEELRAYAAAAIEVQRINEAFQPQLQAADSPEDVEAVRVEATGKMVEAVEDEGLSVERYNEIFQAAQADPAVAEQVSRYVQEMQ
ncbi:MAG: DUF4168 domain-containing protein [Rhodospirillales bacterium]|nr:MAG: DUF4168 domain-containing protein [Rhodospirillales bacterium]